MKIVDGFIFYNEIELLKVRLEELYDVVDYFILVEGIMTFTGNTKMLYYSENKSMFDKYADKILHIIADDFPETTVPWDRERYQRNLISLGIATLNLDTDDIIMISDIDEIPSSDMIYNIRNNILPIQNDIIYSIEMTLYYYTLEWTCENKWYHPKLLKYSMYMQNTIPETIRHAKSIAIRDGGWHISYYGDTSFIVNKLQSYSETGDNTEQNRNSVYLEYCIQNGKLFFNNQMLKNVSHENNTNLPYSLRNDVVPKTAFTYWEGNELSYLHYYTVYSFCKLNPTYEVIIYYDEYITDFHHPSNVTIHSNKTVKIDEILKIKNVRLVKMDWNSFTQEIYKITSPILKADILRIIKLYEHGGIWFDLDILFLKPIPLHLLKHNIDITYFKYFETIPTGFIISTPRNKCITEIYDDCLRKLNTVTSISDLQFFGPSLWRDVEKTNVELFKNCVILENDVVYPYMWNESELFFFTNEDRIKPNTICIHWYNGNEYSRKYINQFENGNIDPNKCVFEKYLHQILYK